MTRATYLDRRWPDVPLFQDVAQRWCDDQSRLLMELVWGGIDLLVVQLEAVPLRKDDEAKEEALNKLLSIYVQQCLSGDEPFCFIHQPPETAKRKRGKGRSPTPDHGFLLFDHPRSIWPLEGKVLDDEHDVTAYVHEITGNFLTGRYASFSSEGAMLGYLLDGDPNVALDRIRARLGTPTIPHPDFSNRPHRVSHHLKRRKRTGLAAFDCHHLIVTLRME